MLTNHFNKRVLLLALPGAGKSTQGQLIAASHSEVLHISFGDYLRANKDSLETSIAGFSIEETKKWKLTDNHASQIFNHAAFDLMTSEHTVLVVDGVPKSASQAQYMSSAFKPDMIVNITGVLEDDLVARINNRLKNENRPDDKQEETIRMRIRTAKNDIGDLLRYFSNVDTVSIDGAKHIETVHEEIEMELRKRRYVSASTIPNPGSAALLDRGTGHGKREP